MNQLNLLPVDLPLHHHILVTSRCDTDCIRPRCPQADARRSCQLQCRRTIYRVPPPGDAPLTFVSRPRFVAVPCGSTSSRISAPTLPKTSRTHKVARAGGCSVMSIEQAAAVSMAPMSTEEADEPPDQQGDEYGEHERKVPETRAEAGKPLVAPQFAGLMGHPRSPLSLGVVRPVAAHLAQHESRQVSQCASVLGARR